MGKSGTGNTQPRRSGRTAKVAPKSSIFCDVGRCLALTLISLTHNYENHSVPAYLNSAFPPLQCLFLWILARKCSPFVLSPIFHPSRGLARTACPSCPHKVPSRSFRSGLSASGYSLCHPIRTVSCHTRQFQCSVALPVLAGSTQVKLTPRRTGYPNQ
jgi:hypothetical protein